MKKIIDTNNAPAAIGPYSQAIVINNMIFTSGQLPLNPETGEIPESIKDQTKQALKNVKAVLYAAGSNLNNVVKTTVFLKDMGTFAEMNEIYKEFFSDNYPARSAVEVAKLPKDALIEIEAIAYIIDC